MPNDVLAIEQRLDGIILIEKRAVTGAAELQRTVPDRKLCVCDFPVEGSEAGEPLPSGATRFRDILIVDHHIPLPRFENALTSTAIACGYVRRSGPLDDSYTVIINHTDADSILSALVMTGRLAPDALFAEAAEAADHTGEENLVADLLQALEKDHDLALSVGTLERILRRRILIREKLRELVRGGGFRHLDGIAWIVLEKPIDAGLVPAVVPDAEVVVVASPGDPGQDGTPRWEIRVRLGEAARDIRLNELGLPDFGGRWNAGSTSRHGGTAVEPEEYVRILQERIAGRRE